MAISVATLGTVQDATGTGATLALSTTNAVSAGALIFVLIGEGNNAVYSAGGSVTDAAGNTYTEIAHGQINPSGDFGQIFYAKNAAALTAGQNITFTKQTSGDRAWVSALTATGIDTTAPLDTAVTTTPTTGSSTTPSITSGTPSVAGELFIGAVASQQNTQLFTQDTGNGWGAPPDAIGFTASNLGSAFACIGGGNQVNAGTGTKTYAPTFSVGCRWAAFICGFKAATGGAAAAPTRTLTGAGV